MSARTLDARDTLIADLKRERDAYVYEFDRLSSQVAALKEALREIVRVPIGGTVASATREVPAMVKIARAALAAAGEGA